MLEIVNLSKSFSDGNKRNVVLDNISFSVLYQDFTVVMGRVAAANRRCCFQYLYWIQLTMARSLLTE